MESARKGLHLLFSARQTPWAHPTLPRNQDPSSGRHMGWREANSQDLSILHIQQKVMGDTGLSLLCLYDFGVQGWDPAFSLALNTLTMTPDLQPTIE